MINPDILTITDDKQLEAFGVFNTDSNIAGRGTFLSRQGFRDAQRYELDRYPSDEVFQLTVISMIERGVGSKLRTLSDGTLQATSYINARRPSQPDFLIDPDIAADVLSTSRYKVNSLADGNRLGMDRDRLSILRITLARAGLEAISMEEFEQPLRLSGDVFMSPPWQKKVLERDPFMLVLGNFNRHVRRLRIDGWFANTAFRYMGRELIDASRAHSLDSHKVADEYFQGNQYIDSAAGLFSLDSVAAYHLVFEQWQELLESDKELPFEGDLNDQYGGVRRYMVDVDKLVTLAQLAVSDKIPSN